MEWVSSSRTSDPDEVATELLFAVPADGMPTVHFIRPSEVDLGRTEGTFQRRSVTIRNGRRLEREPSLDDEGFLFARHTSMMQNFYDDGEIRRTYYPEMEALAKRLTCAGKVHVFDHTVRGKSGTRGTVEVELPSEMLHCDLTERAALETLQLVAPEAMATLPQGRVMQLNLWRPIVGPLMTLPLAVCDGRSIAPESCVLTPLVRPDLSSEFLTLAHDPGQRWAYLPAMQTDEVIVLKNYDSDPAMSPFCVHGAFVDPSAPSDAAPRESIEIRVFVVL